MQIFSTTLTAGESWTIKSTQNVLQFAVEGSSTEAAFTITGNASISQSPQDPPTLSTACPVSGSYNSGQASTSSTWDGVLIEVSAGTVSLIMTRE